MIKRTLRVILAVVMALGCLANVRASGNEQAQYLPAESASMLPARAGSYGAYLAAHSHAEFASAEIFLQGESYASREYVHLPALHEPPGSVISPEEGHITWEFYVEQAGLYNIEVAFTNIPGRGSTIERTFYINGELPYRELSFIRFHRMWENTWPFGEYDVYGNSIRPSYNEVQLPRAVFLRCAAGHNPLPLAVYLASGQNTITMVSEREPMLVDHIRLAAAPMPMPYAATNRPFAQTAMPLESRILQAELHTLRTDRSNIPISSRDSAATMPQAASNVLINSMSGDRWRTQASALFWDFTPDASGYFHIAMRGRQSVYSGMFSTRALTINGEVPFGEASNLRFPFSQDWRVTTLGDDEHGYYKFYFEAGQTYRIGLSVELGDMSEVLRRVENSMFALNEIYRTILMITGPDPDRGRDFGFRRLIPDTIEAMDVQSRELRAIVHEINTLTAGMRTDRTGLITYITHLLDRMYARPSDIADTLINFRESLSALGNWLLESTYQPLDLDWIAIITPDDVLPRAGGGFFRELWFSFRIFLASFTIDWTRVGATIEADAGRQITVWLASGRDQAQITRQLIDSTFTPATGIGVNLQLVDRLTLLPSILSGVGPDVFLGAGLTDPVNFATRGALQDLTYFQDFDYVAQWFHPSAFVSYTFNDQVFALPENQSFMMMFYRRDILDDLGLVPPRTWQEFSEIIPEFQIRNLTVGMPPPNLVTNVTMHMYLVFLFQQGMPLYTPDGSRVLLDTAEAIRAFEKFTDFYTLHRLPVDFDFANRFRSGEMPLGFADYTLYNQFAVFAPEIRGLWGFTSLPGTERADGSIDFSIPGAGSGTIMMSNNSDKYASWEFMRWWGSAATQANFGIGMESIMGEAAMYPTANLEALSMLPWHPRDYAQIRAQWEHVVGVPEVPGGYYTVRSFIFAFNRLINTHRNQAINNVFDVVDPGDILTRYVPGINAELLRKRREFGLE